MVGRVLAGRYRLLEKVGEGGMAVVYRAQCNLLRRVVAVKVLRPQFSGDDEFVERFKREAQWAASLSHPNIVNIYDVGQDGSDYFIVMEFVEGRSLKDIIREKGPMPPAQAAWVALQVCQALDHAHHHNVIHRDIKPHNILVTSDGRVKVADFGIARAQSTTTLTNTGTIVGTVSYFSPEQARGVGSGRSSDIYSLGVVLYELLTGCVPFKGDSAIAVALKHIQDAPTPPGQIVPGIPEKLEGVALKAMQKNPGDRYSSAAEVARDLEPLAEPLDPEWSAPAAAEIERTKVAGQPQAAPAGGCEHEGERRPEEEGEPGEADGRGQEHGQGQSRPQAQEQAQGQGQGQAPEQGQDRGDVRDTGAGRGHEDRGQGDKGRAAVRVNGAAAARSGSKRPGRRGRNNRVLAVAGILAVVFVVAFVGAYQVPKWLYVAEVRVPDLVGLTLTEALSVCKHAGLSLDSSTRRFNADVEQDRIIAQDPQPGRKVKQNSRIEAIVSLGPETVAVPPLYNLTVREAAVELERYELYAGNQTSQPSDEVAQGKIVDQNPTPGARVAKGTAVDIVVSSGAAPGTIAVPELVGRQREEAVSELSGAGLLVGTVTEVTDSRMPARYVISQNPEAGTLVRPGTLVDLVVSKGGQPGTGSGQQPGGGEADVRPVTRLISLEVPQGLAAQEVRVVIADYYGRREVYRKIHSPGDSVSARVTGFGKTTIQVFLDGELLREEKVFD